jgi:peroxiredoxin
MKRRDFLRIGGAGVIGPALAPIFAHGATPERATVLYDDRSVTLADTEFDQASAALWVRAIDLPLINGFEIKPEGACRADICVPLPAAMTRGAYFNLTAFAGRAGQAVVADLDARIWSFGEIPTFRSNLLASRVAPDFTVPDRTGRPVRLSDFRGKKVLLVTWASWCGCREDLVGWQKVYAELGGSDFEIIAAAEDTAGEAVVSRWYDAAKPTYTTLVDKAHAVSSAFQFMNVPSGAWIDEEGRVVRPGEPAWTTDRTYSYGTKAVVTQGTVYVAALRDWVRNGPDSRFALDDTEFARRVTPASMPAMEADASFKLGVWFQEAGQGDKAARYFERAQLLNPDNWNYSRQAWSFTPADAGKKWFEKFQQLDEPYYDLKLTPRQ